MSSNHTRAVLFDLDGTLIDTAPDFVAALNRVLINAGHKPVSYQQGRERISDGSLAMLRSALGHTVSDAQIGDLRTQLLTTYEHAIYRDSCLFPTMDTVLSTLEAKDIKWGIVTNKPGYLTDKLLREMALYDRSACVVSGDTLDRAKPHPDPVLHACELINVAPKHCLMVGDSHRDIDAGRAAGARTLAVRYGYIPQDENADEWNAHAWADSPIDILDVL